MVYFPKRLQVFVSSTYLDLIEERQAAVQAILEAKHIPAGMELFTSGDQSQWEVIKHWIDQSDVYLLILGGRYGSIDPHTGKSYTHLEYEYALERKIPVFSCVLRDPEKRAMEKQDFAYVERKHPDKYDEFKTLVTSKMVKFWENSKDIEKSIILTLKEFEQRENIIGWVRGDKQIDLTLIKQENAKLKNSNQELIQKLEQEKANYDQKLQEIQLDKEKSETTLQEQINQLKQELLTKNAKIAQLKDQIDNLSSLVSTIETVRIKLNSSRGVDYTKLRDLLAAGKWKEADLETANVMFQVANQVSKNRGRIEDKDIDNFPCGDLQTIDQLWVKYSNGRFGFSVQKKIYIDDLGGTREYNQKIWYEFCDRVGWAKGGNYTSYSRLTFDLIDTAPVGYLPSLWRGLVWVGSLLSRKDW